MANAKISQKILTLKKEASINGNIPFPKGTEFEIVGDIVYIKGLPIPPDMQKLFYNWLVRNMADTDMFKEDLRRFK